MSKFNDFELTNGNIRKLSEEEEAFINGTLPPVTRPRIADSSTGELEAGARRVVPDGRGGFKPVASTVSEAPTPVAPTTYNERVDDSTTVICIPKASKRVVIKCAGVFGDDGRAGTFTVGIDALSVEVEDDGVSILMRSDVDVRPPSLAAMTVEVEGVSYNVIYAGGKHRLGNYINMSFTRV